MLVQSNKSVLFDGGAADVRIMMCQKDFNALRLWTTDKTYLGRRPQRTFYGFTYEGGFSDHLPLIVDFYLHLPAEKEKDNE